MFHIISNTPGPNICIVACTHGNETAGIKVFEELMREGIGKKVKKGSLRLLVSNISTFYSTLYR